MSSIIDKIQQTKKKRILKQLAELEFEQARGKQHLELLVQAQQSLKLKVNNLSEKIRQLNNKRRQIENSTHFELQKALEFHIVSTRILEIPGIGKNLGESIIKFIYKHSITDLRNAYRLQGIGENKQYAINRWIRKYENEIPRLLKQDFPEKNKLLLISAKKISAVNEEIGNLQLIKNGLEEKLETINPWINKLGKITREVLINARLDHIKGNSEIDQFIKGVFGEWESMPDWFREVLNEANNV